MKKFMMAAIGLIMAMSANAQYLNVSETPFSEGKAYIGASLTGSSLSYSGSTKGCFGLQGKVGYFFADNIMGLAQLSYNKQADVPYSMSLGAGGRYYIVQNGLYLGATALFKHQYKSNDFLPSVQVGYSFFINRTVTIEPELYYEQSFKNHKDFSTVGLRIGIGVYLFKDTYKNLR